MGCEFFDELPTDLQLEKFLKESRWSSDNGPSAGGINRALWKRLFEREVPIDLFPELKK